MTPSEQPLRTGEPPQQDASPFSKLMGFWISQKLMMVLIVTGIILYGVAVAPFDWQISWLPRNPVAVDAIPDIGENQQIVFTIGRAVRLKTSRTRSPIRLLFRCLVVPGVKAIRSNSFFGFSTIYIIFKEDMEFYWSRSRILEKLNSLPAGTLPEGVQPTLGPDATALGQVFWYTVEGEGFSLG